MENVTEYIIYAGIILAALSVYYFVYIEEQPVADDWLELPYLNEYLSAHPECTTSKPESAKCFHCFSEEIIIQPLVSAQDRRYEHCCANCQQTLFRSRALV